jgi:hypothetical protein
MIIGALEQANLKFEDIIVGGFLGHEKAHNEVNIGGLVADRLDANDLLANIFVKGDDVVL